MQKKIEQIKNLLKEANERMSHLTNDNFDESFPEIKGMLADSQKQKNALLAVYPPAELKVFEPELNLLTKQLTESFDNIIKKKREDLSILAEKIKSVQNKMKLANYHR